MKFQGLGDDDVVISGIGCKLPESDNFPELAQKLFEGINLVTKDDPKLSTGNRFKFLWLFSKFNFVFFFFKSFFGACPPFQRKG